MLYEVITIPLSGMEDLQPGDVINLQAVLSQGELDLSVVIT